MTDTTQQQDKHRKASPGSLRRTAAQLLTQLSDKRPRRAIDLARLRSLLEAIARPAETDNLISELIRAAWEWGVSCEVDDVRWGKDGDSYNQMLRDRTLEIATRIQAAACAAHRAEIEGLRHRVEATERVTRPESRDVDRHEDMSRAGYLRVGLDSDNDVYVEVYRRNDETPSHSVEFCNGGNGGGKSPRTRQALVALMVAMEADNAEDPAFDFWARRGVTKKDAKP